ncbi:MAG: hypothetical protein IJ370_05030 [Oscillospiraceae bacterium]|nr:hypothetical protein [Oscillospiraceae bacterium]
MKKILALLVTGLMLLSFAACNSSETEKGGSSDIKSNVTEQKKELSHGKIDGDTYKNEYYEFEFTKPASWVYSTDEEIAAAMNMTVDQFGDNFADAVENGTTVLDMMVVDTVTGTNINVGIENLSKSFASNITEEQYVDAIKRQLSAVETMDIEFSDKTEKVNIGGNDYLRASLTNTVSGITMTQVYYLRNVDGYMCVITVTLVSGYEIADVEAMFS